jgi:hypothetical protein
MASIHLDGPCAEIAVDTALVKEAITTTSENFALGAAAGFLGGVCQTYAGQPFDTVKVRMQTASSGNYGFFKTGLLTYRTEGIRGLYHGTTPALVFGLLENTIAFGVNEQLKRYLMKQQKSNKDLPLEQLAFCGAACGLVHCIFSCPTEVVKCKLQVTNSPFRGPIHCAQSTVRDHGIGGLYKGFTPFVLREVPFYLCFFTTYELICGRMQHLGVKKGSAPRSRDSLSALEVICAGGLAGMVGWSGVQPFDTAMVRMQTGVGVGGDCASFPQTCGAIYRANGWRGFFPGWIPAMLRAFPANAALFVGFEESRRVLKRAFPE